MIEIYKTQAGTELLHRHELLKLDSMEKGCWINLVSPTEEEIELVVNSIDVDRNFLRDALDDEEKPRIDVEDGQTLIIIDIPYVYEDNKTIKFETLPMGFLTVRDDYIITISSRQTTVLERFRNAQDKGFLYL